MASATPLPMSAFNIAASRSLSCNMIDFLVDGDDPASGFAVAQFIVVKGCSGNLLKLVPRRHALRQKKPPSLLSAAFHRKPD